MNVNRIFHVAFNVTDLDRSIAFYERLGFHVLWKFTNDPETARTTLAAFGEEPNDVRAAFLRLGDDSSSTVLDLCQWVTRPTDGQPYDRSNHCGIFRMAFHVDDPESILAGLEEMGVPLVGPIGYGQAPDGQPSTVFCFRDPDGIFLEVLSGVEHMVAGVHED